MLSKINDNPKEAAEKHKFIFNYVLKFLKEEKENRYFC